VSDARTEVRSEAVPPVAIGLGPAFGVWTAAWLLGSLVAAPLAVLAMGADFDDLTIPELLVATAATWAVFIAGLIVASHRFGTADPVTDYALSFRPIDLVGIPAGLAAQLLVIPVLYIPLQHWWPDTFSDEKLEERASELVDKAGGFNTVVLVLLVVVGAPIVEELVYRGLLQRSISTVIGAVPALIVTSAWFALIHPSPVEFPGLFVAGIAFGIGVVVTRRIGMGLVTHAAFNATAVVMALRDG
jgi:membrane protease YdiL (CAAX protease family)